MFYSLNRNGTFPTCFIFCFVCLLVFVCLFERVYVRVCLLVCLFVYSVVLFCFIDYVEDTGLSSVKGNFTITREEN